MQKILIGIGTILILMGIIWPFLSKLPIGRLPGDIIINKSNMKIYVPITTMILISIFISFILWLLRK